MSFLLTAPRRLYRCAQVSLDAAWGPYDVDGRNYPWVQLAEAVDVFFVMAYDTRSQIYDACLASANSPPRS